MKNTVLAPAVLASAILACVGCGAQANSRATLEELKAAMGARSTTPGDREANTQLAVRVVEEGALENLRRDEVIDAIGRGNPCSVRPACAERGYEDDDWIYDIGDDPTAPSIVVGFDTSGRVSRSTYITH
ncbi:MAG: hypothetical protein IPK60_08195 [Sandaracinaceae bacterium]|jgi:hypothetical protein|nr:hypothetical protein [Sandaracinaceae bacterium]